MIKSMVASNNILLVALSKSCCPSNRQYNHQIIKKVNVMIKIQKNVTNITPNVDENNFKSIEN